MAWTRPTGTRHGKCHYSNQMLRWHRYIADSFPVYPGHLRISQIHHPDPLAKCRLDARRLMSDADADPGTVGHLRKHWPGGLVARVGPLRDDVVGGGKPDRDDLGDITLVAGMPSPRLRPVMVRIDMADEGPVSHVGSVGTRARHELIIQLQDRAADTFTFGIDELK